MLLTKIDMIISYTIETIANSPYSIIPLIIAGLVYILIFFIYKKFKKRLSYALAVFLLSYIQVFSLLAISIQLGNKLNTPINKSIFIGAIIFSVIDLMLIYLVGKRQNYINYIILILIAENIGSSVLLITTFIFIIATTFVSNYGKIYKFIITKNYEYLSDNLPWE